jgi:hypothetical protein
MSPPLRIFVGQLVSIVMLVYAIRPPQKNLIFAVPLSIEYIFRKVKVLKNIFYFAFAMAFIDVMMRCAHYDLVTSPN